MKLPTQKIFGFGERYANFTLTQGAWTMWNSGNNKGFDDGTGGQ